MPYRVVKSNLIATFTITRIEVCLLSDEKEGRKEGRKAVAFSHFLFEPPLKCRARVERNPRVPRDKKLAGRQQCVDLNSRFCVSAVTITYATFQEDNSFAALT